MHCRTSIVLAFLLLFSPGIRAQPGEGPPEMIPLGLGPQVNRDGVQNAAPGADFDGAGRSFPASGIAWGKDVSLRGIRFRLPPAEGADHVACEEQRIPLPEGAPAEWLFFLAAASRDIYQDGLLTIETAAGAARTPIVGWAWNPDDAYGDREEVMLAYPQRLVSLRTPVRVAKDGRPEAVPAALFLWAVRLDPAAAPKAVVLPKADGIRIFAMTLARGVPFAELFCSQVHLGDWKFKSTPEDQAAAAVDDSGWETVNAGHGWPGREVVWFRKKVVVPPHFAGMEVVLGIGIQGDGEIYVDEKRRAVFAEGDADILLTEKAKAGQTFQVAVRATSRPQLVWERDGGHLKYAVLQAPELDRIPMALGAARAAVEVFGPERRGESVTRPGTAGRLAESPLPGGERKDVNAGGEDPSWFDAPEAWGAMEAAWAKGGIDGLRAWLAELPKRFPETARAMAPLELTFFGHSHMDMEWRWVLEETEISLRNTFEGICDYMDRMPFTFAQSQASAYDLIEKKHPETFARVKAAAKKGLWFPVGGMWSECDLNMPSGEALVRQLLYGKRYFREKFGVDVTVGWNPDSFGHAASLPQILSKAGIDVFVLERCAPYWGPFTWEGIDGTKLFCWRPPAHYNRTYIDLKKMLTEAKGSEQKHGTTAYGSCYGIGDHGGYPPMADTRRTVELGALPLFPKAKFGSPVEFLGKLRSQAKDVPELKGELNSTFEGCYTSHTHTKAMNRRCESRLGDAEALYAAAEATGLVKAARFRPLEQARRALPGAWQSVLLNQFHDILPGSSGPATYGPADWPQKARGGKDRYDGALAAAEATRTLTAELLTKAVPTAAGEGTPVVLWNPLSWERREGVQVAGLPADWEHAAATDEAGGQYLVQRVEGGHLVSPVSVPSLGWRVLRIRKTDSGVRTQGESGAGILANDRVRVEIDPAKGCIRRAVETATGREILAGDGDRLEFRRDEGNAWDIVYGPDTGPFGSRDPRGPFTFLPPDEPPAVSVIENGPVRRTVEIVQPYKGSKLVRRISLVQGDPRIHVRFTRDWKDDCAPVLVKSMSAMAVKDPVATREIPYGALGAATDGREFCGQTWGDVSERDGSRGVALLNDGRYGFSVKGAEIGMTLLRDYLNDGPDLQPEDAGEGTHELAYVLYPHEGDWRAGEVGRRGWELNHPVVAVVTDVHAGSRNLSTSGSFLTVEGRGVAAGAFKPAEDGKGWVLRLVQMAGEPAAAGVHGLFNIKRVRRADLMEKPGEEIPVTSGVEEGIEEFRFSVEMKPFAIETVILD